MHPCCRTCPALTWPGLPPPALPLHPRRFPPALQSIIPGQLGKAQQLGLYAFQYRAVYKCPTGLSPVRVWASAKATRHGGPETVVFSMAHIPKF